MTAIAPSTLTEWLESAARAAAGSLAVGEALTPGLPSTGPVTTDLPVAVLVPFGGAVSGEFAVFVDQQVADALRTSDIGPLDLADALAPVVQAVGAALGSAALGTAQTVDGALAASRLAARAESGTVLLTGLAGPRAALAIGTDAPAPGAPAARPAAPLDRFEMLRGVEMQASVELGRAKVTINELLSLRSGEVIELDRAAGEPADLYVNGRLIARGEVVVIDENYGLRITQLITDDGSR